MKHSFQGIPRPDKIRIYRGNGDSESETISSTGYYHACCNDPPVKMDKKDVCFAFSVAQQFNGYALPSPRTYSPKCCSLESYVEYQGVRIPLNHVPDLWEVFDKYRKLQATQID